MTGDQIICYFIVAVCQPNNTTSTTRGTTVFSIFASHEAVKRHNESWYTAWLFWRGARRCGRSFVNKVNLCNWHVYESNRENQPSLLSWKKDVKKEEKSKHAWLSHIYSDYWLLRMLKVYITMIPVLMSRKCWAKSCERTKTTWHEWRKRSNKVAFCATIFVLLVCCR